MAKKSLLYDSLPNGTGQSVLFFAWLNTLEDADKNEVIHIANTLAQHTGSDTQVTTFEDALASLKAGLEPTKIPLTVKRERPESTQEETARSGGKQGNRKPF